MDVLGFIDEIEDIVEAGSSVPFSGKVMVDKEEILFMIQEIRLKLPDEIKKAAWIKEQEAQIISEAEEKSNEMVADAERRAEAIMNDTRERLSEMLDEDRITQKANSQADEILNKARFEANEIRRGALSYADDLLYDTQEGLKHLIGLLDDNRKELQE